MVLGLEVGRRGRWSPERARKGGRRSASALVDRVATTELEPGRYEMTAVAETAEQVTGRGSTEFIILAP